MIERIKKLGLNEYEARAYKALLRQGRASAVSVSRHASIPRARVYDILFSLEKKGFVVKSASKPIEFSAVKPVHAFEAISKGKRDEMEASLSELKATAEALQKGIGEGQGPADDGAVLLLEGRLGIYSFLGRQLENCTESVVISSSEDGIRRKKEAFEKKFSSLSRDGVKVFSKQSHASRFVVLDKEAVMLFLNSEREPEETANEKAIFIKSPFVANYFYNSAMKK